MVTIVYNLKIIDKCQRECKHFNFGHRQTVGQMDCWLILVNTDHYTNFNLMIASKRVVTFPLNLTVA